MSLTSYGEYKESSIPWVGDVPAHWHVTPLLGVAIERSESNIGMQEDNLLSLSYGRIIRKDMESNHGLLPESFETYQIVCKDDIILRLTDLQNDKRSLRSALVQEQGIITSAYLALQPTGASSTFLAYLLRAYDLTKVFYSMGGGLRQSMKFSDLKRMPIALPPIDEQTAIAAFLDRETAKIDALIAEQEKLIVLLAEKRQATISHAVTRGLNPDTPMKDSGVPWLGEVPAHWKIQRLKTQLTLVSEKAQQRSNPIALENIESWSGHFVETESEFEAEGTAFENGDILFGKLRPYLAKVFLAITRGEAVGDFHVLRPNHQLHGRFVQFQMLNKDFINVIDGSTFGSKMPRASWQDLGNMPFLIPPPSEQTAITTFLETKLSNIDNLKLESERAITLLKERRSALITAAVTGQIDVRS